MNKIEKTLHQQALALLDAFYEMAGDKKEENILRLTRIGEWWRLVHTARFYYDEINLTKQERVTLREGEKLFFIKAGTPKLPEKKVCEIQEAIAASQYECDVGLGITCCIRITSFLCTTEEAVILFRIACERFAYAVVDPANPSEIARNERIEFARLGSRAKHSKPGGAWEKTQRIRELWASGNYSSRDICAEQEFAALNWNYSSARKALRGTPDPS